MKIPVILMVLFVIYCIAADDAQKKSKPEENAEGDNKEGAGMPPSTTPSPPRARRSPPRFDANQMKGKYAKSNKIKRSVIPYFDMERTSQLRSIADYFSPSSTLLYAVQPPIQKKTAGATTSA